VLLSTDRGVQMQPVRWQQKRRRGKHVNTSEKREDQNGGAVHAWMEE
jgi:hypothetical protein